MTNEPTSKTAPLADKIMKALLSFFQSTGGEIKEIDVDADLIQSTGVESLQGLDFALDLEDVLGAKVPPEFNPFIHPSGRRGMKFRELVEFAEGFVAAEKGGNHGSE